MPAARHLPVDLHCHSTVSDGSLAPAVVVARAAARGARLLALTDHDDLRGLEEAQAAAALHQVGFVPGVEISVTWKRRTIHVVGLRVDPGHVLLQQGLMSVRSGRMDRAQRMAAGLAEAGIPGALDAAMAFATNPEMISRTHFARFLVASGRVKSTRAVFKRFLVPGKPGYVPHDWAALADAVGWICAAGGVAVLAHPGRYDLGRENMALLLEDFRAAGGSAIEVVTGNHSAEQVEIFASWAYRFGLRASVGSDFHAPGESSMEPGVLPALPGQCVPVWLDWPEAAGLN